MRAMMPRGTVASATEGSMKLEKPRAPPAGKMLKLTEKTMINIIPSQKTGIEMPRTAPPEMTKSSQVLRLSAATTPATMPTTMAISMPPKVSASV